MGITLRGFWIFCRNICYSHCTWLCVYNQEQVYSLWSPEWRSQLGTVRHCSSAAEWHSMGHWRFPPGVGHVVWWLDSQRLACVQSFPRNSALTVLPGEVSVQFLCLFFNWVFCLPGLELCEFFVYSGDQTLVQNIICKYDFPYGWFSFNFNAVFFSHAEAF